MVDVSPILPWLHIGAAPASAAELRELRSQTRLTALLSLQTDADLALRNLSWEREAEWCRAHGIEARRLPIEDWSAQDVIDHMDEAVEALRDLLEDGHIVYLHCTAGVNRSPSVAVGYLVRVKGHSLADALAHVQRSRPTARPYAEVLDVLRGETSP